MPSRSTFLTATFIISLILWTIALLIPIPSQSSEVLGGDRNKFLFAKALHASAYAYLTILAGYLTLQIRTRWLVLGLLSFHGFATEFFQQFVNRGASCATSASTISASWSDFLLRSGAGAFYGEREYNWHLRSFFTQR